MTNMDLMALLSTVVLVATIATTIFAVAAYAVSRGYTRKKSGPKGPTLTSTHAATGIPVAAAVKTPVLKRYNPFEPHA